MKAIIIAAGRGGRLKHLTEDRPKTLLDVNGISILENIIKLFRGYGIEQISIIRGYMADKIRLGGVTYFLNDDYPNNNILHSLMYARAFMDDDLIVSYSDIWLENEPVEKLIKAHGECVLSVDTDWEERYVGRTDHPISDAENVLYNDASEAVRIGKHVSPDPTGALHCGEFIGLFKMSKFFTEIFRSLFDEIDGRLSKSSPFQKAPAWQKAYVTDIIQEFIDRGYSITCSLHKRQWAEIDTIQDYNNLLKSKGA